MHLLKGSDFWIIVDLKGKIWKISDDFVEQEVVFDFHAGKIMDLALSYDGNAGVTLGEDGSTRLWDYTDKSEVYTKKWLGKGTALSWSP